MRSEKRAQDPDTILSEWRHLIDAALQQECETSLCDSKTLQAAVNYVLQGHGKRLRGLLAMSIQCDLTQGDDTRVPLRPAVALEMLHAASLVHDDLPALDDDDMRRGRPSCHRAFSEATAILTGDYLVGRAILNGVDDSLSSNQQLRLVVILARAWSDVCVGQQLDIEGPSKLAEETRLMELKTGALFGASAACGALCAHCDGEQVTRFQKWGERVGVLFQKIDDVADGDGVGGARLNEVEESERLVGDLRACQGQPLPLTEALLRVIVGRNSSG